MRCSLRNGRSKAMRRYALFKYFELGLKANDLLAVLFAMHPDQGNQLQQYMHLPNSPSAAQGGSRD
jgi:hypothetical protein